MNSRRAGPPPPVPRGDGPGRKVSFNRARARVRAQGTVLAPSAGHASTGSGQALRSGGTEGLTSSMGAEGRFPPAAAGRRGMARRSASWSRSLQAAPMRQARSDGLRPGALASAWTASSSRLALRTIRPGMVSLAAARIVPFLWALRCRLWGLALGATLSSLGIPESCPLARQFQPMFAGLRLRSCKTGVDT